MKRKTIYRFILFSLLVVIQLLFLGNTIFNQEDTLKSGTAYKFKTRPIDPNDPFKGKYIILNYEIETYKTNDSLWEYNEPVYVYLSNDTSGFAIIDTVSRHILPKKSNDYVLSENHYYSKYSKTLRLNFPFDEYYMKETKAYNAEVAVRNRQRDSLPNNTYALVYIKNGNAVLDDVIIDTMSIKDYVEKNK